MCLDSVALLSHQLNSVDLLTLLGRGRDYFRKSRHCTGQAPGKRDDDFLPLWVPAKPNNFPVLEIDVIQRSEKVRDKRVEENCFVFLLYRHP